MSRQTLLDIADKMEAAGDAANAGRVRQLSGKTAGGTLHLAFCGHFSAGKSTLVNRLCGTKLLPSSPIPTSANVVTIRNGEAGVTLYYGEADGEAGETRRTIDLQELDVYCKDGGRISAIDIRYPLPQFGDRLALVDTPGVDSTDDAHRMATESALHLADVVFFVMDYNHVMSEMNLSFTKQLLEWGKPLYLIVNQIDKHRERELSFADYDRGVRQAFADWNIRPDGLLYLSLKHPEHPYDEYDKLLALIEGLKERAEPLVGWSVQQSVAFLIDEHEQALRAQNEAVKSRLRREAEQIADREDKLREADQLEARLRDLAGRPERLFAEWRAELNRLIDNANLTPAGTRELAARYLESRQPGFKVGFFGRAAKTEKERADRLAAFCADYAEKVSAHLDFHLKEYLRGLLKAEKVEEEPLLAAVDELHLPITPDWLAQQVSTGALASGEYTLNYMRDVAAETRGFYRRQALDWLERLRAAVAERTAAEAERTQAQLLGLRRELSAHAELDRLERQEREQADELRRMAAAVGTGERPALPEPDGIDTAKARAAAGADDVPAAAAGAAAANVQAAFGPEAPLPAAAGADAEAAAASAHGERLLAASRLLSQAAELAGDLPALRPAARAMRDKAARLADNRFTVALFGAFSAGKSSFANALMGAPLLPVSPNPTTAAINTIRQPEDGWPHGTAKVKMKNADFMLAEVRYSLDFMGLPGDSWEVALQSIDALRPEHAGPNGKPHYAFLQAVRKGWTEAEPLLGRELQVDFAEFAAYVAREERSCFVESIELFVDNPLTRQGIVLVDTPGADSINARHTGVAFNYIKNADAIVFVTYYNHAFSQADREFLLQLGRVKDSFELDKMFFVVNAADLAGDEQELAGVVEHVKDNLLRHGIREPRIFPLSSMQALEAKLAGDRRLLEASGIERFVQEFMHFAFHELADIALGSAYADLERSAAVLDEWIAGAREEESERRKRLRELDEAKERALRLLETPDSRWRRELDEELRELLYYVKQRTQYRFGDLYNYAFNPAALNDTAGGDIRQKLRACWLELLRLVSYDVSQEVLATTLRIEQFLKRKTDEYYERCVRDVTEVLAAYPREEREPSAFVTPEVAEAVEAPEIDGKRLVSLYKNGKHFFEGEGKQKMRAELETIVDGLVAAYLDRHRTQLAAAYENQQERQLARMLDRLKESVSEHADGLRDALEQKVDLDHLSQMKQQLQRLLSQFPHSASQTSTLSKEIALSER